MGKAKAFIVASLLIACFPIAVAVGTAMSKFVDQIYDPKDEYGGRE